MRVNKHYVTAALLALVLLSHVYVAAQTATDVPADDRRPRADEAAVRLYFDPAGGVTADEAVARALASNGELLAVRGEGGAARALGRAAGYRGNPRPAASGSKAVATPDKQALVEGLEP